MLTLVDDRAAPPRPMSVRVEVASDVVRLALLYVARDAGWGRCGSEESCRCLVVADKAPDQPGVVDVLVVRDLPAACQAAVDATLRLHVRAVVVWNQPSGLVAACEAVRGCSSILVPRRVVELSGRAPRLTVRQLDTLRLLSAGRSSVSIGRALHQSESTAKRDITELLALFDVPNRTALVAAAARLGFVHPSAA